MNRATRKRSEYGIFMVGSQRTGTTLLRYLLDAHEHLACPPESKIIGGLNAFAEYPQTLKGLSSLGLTMDEIRAEMRRFVEAFLSEYATRKNKRRWVDKTPNNFRHLDLIDTMFSSEVLYIFVIRHPLDCIYSLDERFEDGEKEDPDVQRNLTIHGRSHFAWANYWNEVYGRIHQFSRAHPDRSFIVKYEDVVQATGPTLRSLLHFLGEEYAEGMVERAFTMKHDAGYGDPKILGRSQISTASVDRWRSRPRLEAASLWPLVAPLARQFGYTFDEVT